MPIYFNGHDLTNRGGVVLTIGNELDYENYTISASGLQKVKDAYQNAIPISLKQNDTLYAVVLLQKDGDDYKLAAVNSRGSYDNIEIDSGTLGITVNGVGPASISSIKPSTDSPYQEMVVNFTVSGENLDGRTMYLGFYSSQDTSTKITPVNTSRFNANNHVQFTGTNYIGIQYADVFDAGTHYFHLGVSLNDNDTNVVFSEMMEYWNQPGGVSP